MNSTFALHKLSIMLLKRNAPALFLLVTMLLPAGLCAQVPAPVPVEISTQKIVAGGKVYYMHQVVKGQTLYSISKAYNVTVDQLTRDNEITSNGIREGQVLKIAANAAASTAASSTASASSPAAPANQDERYIYHRVKRGETLSSIAAEYGISVRDLRKANKGLLFPHEGDSLMIPRKKITGQPPEEKPLPDTVALPEEPKDTMAVTGGKEIFTALSENTVIRDLKGSVKVAVMLPFFINENNSGSYVDSTKKDAQGNKIYREVNMDESWIYEGSLPFLEAYEGILIAVDSLRSLGLTVELDVYDIAGDTTALNRVIWSGMLNDADLIIGPVFSASLNRMAAYAAARDIPIVSPVPLRDQNIVENRPTLYRVFPSASVSQDIVVRELAAHKGSNVVFLYADTLMNDPKTSGFWNRIKKSMVTDNLNDTTLLTAQYFTGAIKKRDTYSGVASFEGLLKPDRENIIILSFTQTPVVSSAFSTLHTLSRKYDIKVIGYPEIGGQETIEIKYYYDLELFIPTESYIDFNSPAAISFTSTFRNKFKTEPMAGSFAWRGFDIAYYFIGGIASLGHDFLKDPGIFNPALLCLDPDFRRERPSDGYENRGMFVLHYKKDMTIEVRRPQDTASPGINSGIQFQD
jgi:LysM repeat protein/ABC-type branched-subunit amino acid transport system substrate-binding protein